METKIDKQKLLELVKASPNIVNVLERLKKELPDYIKGYVSEECLVNLYLGLPNKNIDVNLFIVDNMNDEDTDLLAKMKEKYKIEADEFVTKRYANRVLDSVTRVVGQNIVWQEKVRGDINSVEGSVTLIWSYRLEEKQFVPQPLTEVETVLNKDHGMLNCAAIYIDPDYNILGGALEDFTVNADYSRILSAKGEELMASQVWLYTEKGINVNKKFVKALASGYKLSRSLSALALAKTLKLVNEDEVGDFIENNQVNTVKIMEYKKRVQKKLKF